MAQPTSVLALLPLENLSDLKEDEIRARGLIQDPITEAARFPMLGAISAQSAISGRAMTSEPEEIANFNVFRREGDLCAFGSCQPERTVRWYV